MSLMQISQKTVFYPHRLPSEDIIWNRKPFIMHQVRLCSIQLRRPAWFNPFLIQRKVLIFFLENRPCCLFPVLSQCTVTWKKYGALKTLCVLRLHLIINHIQTFLNIYPWGLFLQKAMFNPQQMHMWRTIGQNTSVQVEHESNNGVLV